MIKHWQKGFFQSVSETPPRKRIRKKTLPIANLVPLHAITKKVDSFQKLLAEQLCLLHVRSYSTLYQKKLK